ncbi:unnamed protein product [Meloidogyne enterolobii]|uniref:Uncharacterized protein n=1 Tax=Meloidogyne enterolobii TaxID=390850 RepID=A0ACB1A3P1_MELEN
MLYIHRFSIFDNQDASNEDKIKLTEVQHSLQDTKQTLFQMRQSLDQQNKKSTEFSTAIEDLNKKLSDMRQVQDQMLIGKNITTHKGFPSSKQFSNNLWVLFCINMYLEELSVLEILRISKLNRKFLYCSVHSRNNGKVNTV